MLVLRWIERLIFSLPLPAFVLAVFGVMLFKVGVWYMPGLGLSQQIAANPFVNPLTDPNAHYIYWSWLPPFLAWVLGIHGEAAYLLYHFAFSLAFVGLFTLLAVKRLQDELARVALLFFVFLPVAGTSFFWVSVDSFTLFFMLLAFAFPQSMLISGLAGVALGMTHFEQGFFGVGAVFFATLLGRWFGPVHDRRLTVIGSVLAGVIAGKVILFAIFHYNDVQVNSGRFYWLLMNYHHHLRQFFFSFQHALWSILAVGWLVALRFADQGRKTVPFFVTIALMLFLLLTVGDQTRVMCIVLFPLVYVFWLSNAPVLARFDRTEVAGLTLLWILIPWIWVWAGVAQPSLLSYDLAMVIDKVVGGFDIPADFSLWPFNFRMPGQGF
ncbi:hypothetical protein ACSV9I_13520 [Rhizobium sp. G187]|uniref:hypothetical protein n=1 Tax=Rhizobium sp. G187 TaxID=3451352 RepID=UPI003EE805CD